MGDSGAKPQTGGITDTDFDYVFTDQELQDILSFMEKQQNADAAATNVSIENIPLSNQISTTPVALQFQPHVQAGPQNGTTLTVAPVSFNGGGTVYVKQDMATNTGIVSGLGTLNGAPQNFAFGNDQVVYTTQTLPFSNGVGTQLFVEPNMSLQPTSLAGLQVTTNPAPAATITVQQSTSLKSSSKQEALKPQVSHSMVEKQRRDRINSLIDELRYLVPPQSANAVQETAEVKRPKHVVLADTIALVKELQKKMKLMELSSDRIPREYAQACNDDIANTGAAMDLIRKTCCDHSPSRENSSSSDSPSACELPTAPEGVLTWAGVIVEQGEGCLYVKVNCKDRRGLLSDVINTLKSLPLEIKTAAITTTREGHIFDVFQITLDNDAKLSARELQYKVHRALHEHAGNKRHHVAVES